MSTIKKITNALVFLILVGSTTVFAQEKDKKVTDTELTKFAGVFEKLQSANDKAQQKMVQLVESEGMEMKRFNEIHVAYINPNIESDATPEELQKHNSVMKKVQKMQDELQVEMDEIVKNSGMTISKYQRIATAMQENMALRDRYKKISRPE